MRPNYITVFNKCTPIGFFLSQAVVTQGLHFNFSNLHTIFNKNWVTQKFW